MFGQSHEVSLSFSYSRFATPLSLFLFCIHPHVIFMQISSGFIVQSDEQRPTFKVAHSDFRLLCLRPFVYTQRSNWSGSCHLHMPRLTRALFARGLHGHWRHRQRLGMLGTFHISCNYTSRCPMGFVDHYFTRYLPWCGYRPDGFPITWTGTCYVYIFICVNCHCVDVFLVLIAPRNIFLTLYEIPQKILLGSPLVKPFYVIFFCYYM